MFSLLVYTGYLVHWCTAVHTEVCKVSLLVYTSEVVCRSTAV